MSWTETKVPVTMLNLIHRPEASLVLHLHFALRPKNVVLNGSASRKNQKTKRCYAALFSGSNHIATLLFFSPCPPPFSLFITSPPSVGSALSEGGKITAHQADAEMGNPKSVVRGKGANPRNRSVSSSVRSIVWKREWSDGQKAKNNNNT